MTVLAVWNETRPGRTIPDPLLDLLPDSLTIERWNYWIWIVAWLPGTLAILALDWRRFSRLMVTCGILSIVRGVAIVATGFGPVRGADVNAALPWDTSLFARAVLGILNPFAVFFRDSAQIWLTKDLFFSGHAATTLLLVLYARPWRRLQAALLALHVLVVASVLLGRVHYTIDVVGAWAATAVVFWLRERRADSCATSAAPAG